MTFPATPPELPGVTHSDVTIDGTRWHVASAGTGDRTIVLLHGWPQNFYIWRHVIGELAQTHRVIAPDLRGFGWSEAPAGTYSKMGLAADVVRLLDALDVDTCTLAGHDWGGFVAWLTAIRAPERIERLVTLSIVHPWFRVSLDPLGLARTTYQLPLATPGVGAAVMRYTPFVNLVLKKGVGPGFRWGPGEAALYADSFRRPDHARASSSVYRTFLKSELRAMHRGRYANRRLDMPVTMVTGEHDPVVTPSRITGAEAHAPHATTEVIPGAGHFLPEELPERVLTLLRPPVTNALSVGKSG